MTCCLGSWPRAECPCEAAGRDARIGACPHIIPSRAVLAGPTGALPNPDLLLPRCPRGDLASRSCVVLASRLYRVAEAALLFLGLALRWLFFLLVRWRPPLRGDPP